jgi:hypothetical protein
LAHGWLNYIDEGSYEPLVLANEEYGSFWAHTNDDLYWSDIKWPAVHQSGWSSLPPLPSPPLPPPLASPYNIYFRYDIFLQQQLDAYTAYRTLSSTPFDEYNFLVVGPGGHCSQGGQVYQKDGQSARQEKKKLKINKLTFNKSTNHLPPSSSFFFF